MPSFKKEITLIFDQLIVFEGQEETGDLQFCRFWCLDSLFLREGILGNE